MKRSLLLLIALVSVVVMAASTFAQVGPLPTTLNQIGTSPVQRDLDVNGQPLLTKRVGVLAYCADIAPRAAAVGIFSWDHAPLAIFPTPGNWGNPNNSPTGFFGAQNLVDMLMYDDEIPRFKDVVLIDGDREKPTAQDLIRNFDCVIAYTDNRCPNNAATTTILNDASTALSTFAQTPGKGVVLTGFAFNQTIGFGPAIFGTGLSPIAKASAAVDTRCTPSDPTGARGACPIGVCPAGATRQFPSTVTAPECFTCPATDAFGNPCSNVPDPAHPLLTTCNSCPLSDPNSGVTCSVNAQGQCMTVETTPQPCGGVTFCGQFVSPDFTPLVRRPDRVCESLFRGVNGPTSSSFANALSGASVAGNATLCANYDAPAADLPLIAVNNNRNIVAVNVFPAYAPDLQKTWFSCVVANAAIYACGEHRCRAATAAERTQNSCVTGRCDFRNAQGACVTCCQ